MRPSSHSGRDNWRLSTVIIVTISLIFLVYLAFLFHLFILPSFSNDSQQHDLILNEKDFIIKSLHRELIDYKNQTKLLESDLETLHQQLAAAAVPPSAETSGHISNPVSGVIILGMHRSGTSIVGGLMNKMGLETGGPLIRPNFDNEKGFFERIDVVIQNDEILKAQRINYSYRTAHYNTLEGIKAILLSLEPSRTPEQQKFFREGSRALSFLNNPSNMPWMLKDPRLCITLRTWLPFLSSHPAVLFTYRNPMDVALSMNTRETEHFLIGRGLKLWYIYNRRAIQQSHDLCRVVTSHKKMMSQPVVELTRIYHELREKCRVLVPHEVSVEDVNEFIDVKLQHGRTSLLDSYCNDPTVEVQRLTPPAEVWKTSDPNHLKLYRSCVQLYCDLESQRAYESHYQFDESIVDE
jgi:hypothetical protein